MGELTNANKQRIHNWLDASARRRRNAELIFLGVFISVMSLLVGYLYGSAHPHEKAVPDWAKKAQEVRERALEGARVDKP